MSKRNLFLLMLLLLTPILVFAQEETDEAEEITYFRLNNNLSVLTIPGWELTSPENETALYSRDDIAAQIYVNIVDTLDTREAIESTIASVDSITVDTGEAILEGSIGRNNGTWNYRIYSEGDTSVTAYALLKSNQVYVVLFAEESPDYDAYHLALRSPINDPQTVDDTNEAINSMAVQTITSLIDETFAGEALSTGYPAEDNNRWVEASYGNNITTASYLANGIVYVTVVEGDVDIAAELSNAFDTVFLGFVITPDNIEFLYLGLAFSGGIMLVLIVSMFLRYQNIKKDMLVLEQLEEE